MKIHLYSTLGRVIYQRKWFFQIFKLDWTMPQNLSSDFTILKSKSNSVAPFIFVTIWIWVQRRVTQNFIIRYFAFLHKKFTIISTNLPLLLLIFTSQIAKTDFQDWTSTVPLPLILKNSPCFTQKTLTFSVIIYQNFWRYATLISFLQQFLSYWYSLKDMRVKVLAELRCFM